MLCLHGLLWAPAVSAVQFDGSALLAELNERWLGARCRIRINVPLKKGKDSSGWTRSHWVVPASQWKFKSKRIAVLFQVSDRAAFPAERIIPGTAFIAEGWTFGDEAKQEDLGLNLRLADTQIRARMSFLTPYGKYPGVDDLRALENWGRIDVFKIKAMDERLSDPKMASKDISSPQSATSDAKLASTLRATVDAGQGELTAVELHALGASVEPNRVLPGGTIQLVGIYTVDGKGTGSIQVTERRSILREGMVLTTLEAKTNRHVGTHQSSQPLTVPATLAPGIYELSVEFEAGSLRSIQTTLFQVLPPSDSP